MQPNKVYLNCCVHRTIVCVLYSFVQKYHIARNVGGGKH